MDGDLDRGPRLVDVVKCLEIKSISSDTSSITIWEETSYFLIRDDFLAFVPSCTLSVLAFLTPFDCSPSLSFCSGRFASELFGGGEIWSRGLDAAFPSSVPDSPIISLANRARSISAARNSTHHYHPRECSYLHPGSFPVLESSQ